MESGLIVLVVFILTIKFTAGARSVNIFGRFDVFNGKVCRSSERVFTVNSSSLVACAAECLERYNCRSFFYERTTGNCYGCRHVSNGHGLETESDNVYFIRIDEAIVLASNSSSITDKGLALVWHGGQWGTVCDDKWNVGTPSNNAIVLCKTLGFKSGVAYGEANKSFSLSKSDGVPIWMDGVVCSGTETHLLQCPFNGFGNNDCDHNEDISVFCDF